MAERHFIVYDLEATCWRHRRSWQVEVIEIGAVKVSENLEVLDEFTAFVRPLLHPEISDFCTRLTSITQADIEDADAFHEVIQAFESWMEPASVRTVLLSWGEFDKRQLLNDARLHQVHLPWLNYHACLQMHYSRWKGSKNQIGLTSALELEGLNYLGTPHRAIEDARNMARLFCHVAGPMGLTAR
jgi:inhibitor of KinA sporulation pathway (predicted exonuclease)